MDLPDVVDDILGHIAKVDYSKTDSKVSLFETTIRYLAGMLSAYDLLTGPCSHLAPDVCSGSQHIFRAVVVLFLTKADV